ncbi:MAG: molybdopterin molybdotransferase MoeA [Gallionellaceae bacterium]|nr:molybdopterin molybdotransferase MoeA [Gallionellaceae bacterium]
MKPKTQLTSLEDAIAQMCQIPASRLAIEEVPLKQLYGRVLAENLHAPVQIPHWDYSAMDGYVLRYADLNANGETTLPISQRITAGSSAQPLEPKTAARIFTGSPIPSGADTVVMQEDCTGTEGSVTFHRIPKQGANIRRAGEDIQRDAVCLAAGTLLDAASVGLAASLGLTSLAVKKRLRVALLCTGDEIIEPGNPLLPGQIHGSNAYILTGMLERAGYEVIDLGQVPDRLDATVAALSRASKEADIIVSTGGVSVGEEDHVRAAVEQAGRLDLWRLNIKPGKPLAFGHVGTTPFVGLPGNPVSAYITCALALIPFLRHLQGTQAMSALTFEDRAAFDWPRSDKRREFLRARLSLGADGTPEATIHPQQGSGVLSSVVWAEGLVDLAEEQTVRRGDKVRYRPLTGMLG